MFKPGFHEPDSETEKADRTSSAPLVLAIPAGRG
jgi:hypothetical protein